MTQSSADTQAENQSGSTEENARVAVRKEAVSPPVSSGSSNGSALTILAIVLAIVACATSAYSWYASQVAGRFEIGRELGRMDGLQREVDRLVVSGASTDARLSDISNTSVTNKQDLMDRISAVDAELKTALSGVAEQQLKDNAQHQKEREALASIVAQVSGRLGEVQKDWQLEEVAHLLILANQRLALTRDVPMALSALRLADERLSDQAEPAVLAVRREIAREIDALSQTSGIGVVETAASLGELIERVGELPLRGDDDQPSWLQPGGDSSQESGSVSEGAAESNPQASWLGRVLESLKSMVRVRKIDETRAPKLESSQRFLAYENLRLQLLVSQLAVLRRDQNLHKSSIDQALGWLNSHFANTDEVQSFADQLSELKEADLGSAVPDISRSLTLLRDEIKRREQMQ